MLALTLDYHQQRLTRRPVIYPKSTASPEMSAQQVYLLSGIILADAMKESLQLSINPQTR